MNRFLFPSLALLVLTAGLRSADPEEPRSADPAFALAHVKDGVIFLRSTRLSGALATRIEKWPTKDGKTEDVTVIVPQLALQEMKLDSKKVPAFDASGKKVDPKTVLDRLQKETVVVVSLDGKPVDPVFLSALKEGTLILIPPWNPREQPESQLYPKPLPPRPS